MDGLRQYIICVVAAALMCSILMSLVRDGFAKELIRLICGLVLTLAVIHPFSKLDFDTFADVPLSFLQNAEGVSSEGQRLAKEAMADIIKAESEAYILDKAAEWNAELTVDIIISNDQTPERAILSGEISPYVRSCMEAMLESDLGITKENQIWTG